MTSREEIAFILLRDAAQEFVDKVESGAARSRRSYAAFKTALAAADEALTFDKHKEHKCHY
jgi:hypothetical protein